MNQHGRNCSLRHSQGFVTAGESWTRSCAGHIYHAEPGPRRAQHFHVPAPGVCARGAAFPILLLRRPKENAARYVVRAPLCARVTCPGSYAKAGQPSQKELHSIDRKCDHGYPFQGKVRRVIRISADAVPAQAFADLFAGALLYELWIRLAFHDIRQRFRRSVLGPLWLTLSMGTMVGALGLVFSTLFQQDVAKTLPYISTGIIFWGLLTSCINEGAAVFISAESFIRNVPIPLSVHFYRMIARNVMIWGFNMVIFFVVAVYFGLMPGWNTLQFVPGFILFLINVAWISLAAGVLSARYRDIPQVIANFIQVVFFVTPVFWSPATLPGRPAFVTLNPFYHLIEIVRAPLLGEPVPSMSWALCIGMALAGFGFTAWLYRRAHARIAYWV